MAQTDSYPPPDVLVFIKQDSKIIKPLLNGKFTSSTTTESKLIEDHSFQSKVNFIRSLLIFNY